MRAQKRIAIWTCCDQRANTKPRQGAVALAPRMGDVDEAAFRGYEDLAAETDDDEALMAAWDLLDGAVEAAEGVLTGSAEAAEDGGTRSWRAVLHRER